MSCYICPCAICPDCGPDPDFDPDDKHPEDGIAVCHQKWMTVDGEQHGHLEYWVHVGPYMDGRHIKSVEEEQAWAAWDIWLSRRIPTQAELQELIDLGKGVSK
jgi:hypothetical protein